LVEVAKELVSIKEFAYNELGVDTSGQPLALHPAFLVGLKKDKNRVLEKKLIDLISKFVVTKHDTFGERLEIVTMTVQVVLDHWRFIGGYVSDGNWSPFVTKFSKQFYKSNKIALGVEDYVCDGNSICTLTPTIKKEAIGGVVLNKIFTNDSSLNVEQVPGYRSESIKIKSETVDNASSTHFFNSNCISCHQSSNLRDQDKLLTRDYQFAGITPFVPVKFKIGLTNNVINFGYWGVTPRVSTRTSAESENVAKHLNDLLGLKPQAYKINYLEGYWSCLNTKKIGMNANNK